MLHSKTCVISSGSSFSSENFLQVDIFYKEISYEEINQQPAFEFLSLLSEVGGFLGLLLGASILTVCELLDYLTMTVMRRWKKTTTVAPAPMDLGPPKLF